MKRAKEIALLTVLIAAALALLALTFWILQLRADIDEITGMFVDAARNAIVFVNDSDDTVNDVHRRVNELQQPIVKAGAVIDAVASSRREDDPLRRWKVHGAGVKRRKSPPTEAELVTWDLNCVYCGACESDHIGPDKICPRRFVSLYRRCWPDDTPGWSTDDDLVSASHLIVPVQKPDGVWCDRCGGSPLCPVHLATYL